MSLLFTAMLGNHDIVCEEGLLAIEGLETALTSVALRQFDTLAPKGSLTFEQLEALEITRHSGRVTERMRVKAELMWSVLGSSWKRRLRRGGHMLLLRGIWSA